MTVFLTTLGLIGAAEMGDKTQLLTLALAARFPLGAVLGGVLVATLLNHALAVAVGGAALLVVPASLLQAAAGLSFIGFGLWTLRGDRLTGNEERRVGPPLVTVAVSFFLAEVGDKTQLATAALAAQATSLVPVWLGSVLGMLLADGLAVAVGHLLGRRLPERPLKIGAAALFLLFGILLLGTRTASDTAPLPGSISVRPGLGEYIQSGSGIR
jgi:putative Ca2+/H+ antiporter (TMEM165/GDT1 family)